MSDSRKLIWPPARATIEAEKSNEIDSKLTHVSAKNVDELQATRFQSFRLHLKSLTQGAPSPDVKALAKEEADYKEKNTIITPPSRAISHPPSPPPTPAMTQQQKRVHRYAQRIDTLIDKATEVSPQKINARVEAIRADADLQSLLDAIDPDFTVFQQLTCRKTGQIVGENTAFAISRAVQLNGRERAFELLCLQSTGHVAPHWFDTSGESLTQLARHDPVGYFVYAVCKCAKFDGPYSINDKNESRRRMLYAYNLEKTAVDTARQAVKQNQDFSLQLTCNPLVDNNKSTFVGSERLQYTNAERWRHHLTRRRMYEALASGRVQMELIVWANEVMRRTLKLCHPREMPDGDYRDAALNAYQSTEHMVAWINAMREFLRRIIKIYLSKNFNRAKDLIRRRNLSESDWYGLRYEKGGLNAFFLQQNLHGVSSVEATLLEIEELDIFDGETNEFSLQLRGRARSNTRVAAKRAENSQKYSGRFFVAPKPQQNSTDSTEPPVFRLKLKPKTPPPESSTN